MSSIILNIVIILGIIIAGGFLIFFLGDLLLSILDPKNEENKINSKRNKEIKNFKNKMKEVDPEIAKETEQDPRVAAILALQSPEEETVEQPAEKEEQVVEVLEVGAVVEAYNPNAAEEEKKEPAEEETEEDEDNEEDRLAEARAALEKRKLEILRRMQEASMEEDEEEESSTEEQPNETEEVESNSSEEVEESTETSESEVEEDVLIEEENVQEEEISGTLDDEELSAAREELEAEKRRYAAMIASLQNNEKTETVISKEEYQERLLKKEEELKENEKDLKICKREYLPLSKVAKTLEKDEKKLRIKEAQVAKQKVVLYGVNNYADLDADKAKKLAEDLDLLDGLKLSVQHCREVMEQNKERLPILERMYKVLKSQNDSIKDDIAYLQAAIEKFDSEN